MVVREIKKVMKTSDVSFAAELFSGMPSLESVKALLYQFVSHNQKRSERQAIPCNVRHPSCAHCHEAPVRLEFVELQDEKKACKMHA